MKTKILILVTLVQPMLCIAQNDNNNVHQDFPYLKEFNSKINLESFKQDEKQKDKQSEIKKEEKFDFEEVIPVNLSKSVLWINLKKWISSTFSSYKHVVDMEDKDAGIVVVKWNSNLENPYSKYWSAQYEATYQIDVRENKYRIKIYNSSARTKPNNGDMKSLSTYSLQLAIKELETVMSISKSLQGTSTWKLDNRFLQVMESNSSYKPLMQAVKDGYLRFNDNILNSLKKSMTVADDF